MRGGKTLVCVSVMVEAVGEALVAAERARAVGADLVEWRVDPLCSGGVDGDVLEGVGRLCAESALPCVLTCRPEWEGGVFDGEESERAAVFGAALGGVSPPRYVDVEKRAWESGGVVRGAVSGSLGDAGLIVSSHDFDGRPADLLRLVSELRSHGEAAVLKIAFRARSVRDNVEVLELLRERDRPTIAVAMGEEGVLSRVCAPKFGGYLTFAGVDGGAGTAPGQVGLEALLGLYRFRSVGRGTRVFGVVGEPVSHSASPAVHNDAFGVAGFDGVYVPMRVAGGWEPFKATVLSLLDARGLDFGGGSVTRPHKEHAVRLAREEGWGLDGVSAACGAGNTLVVMGSSVRVLNTDAAAVVEPLRERLGAWGLRGARVAVVGTGGAARAAAVGLALEGARVGLYGRDGAKAERVAGELAAGLADVAGAGDGGVGVVEGLGLGALGGELVACVHCTPVGMRGGGAEGEVAFDVGAVAGVGVGGVVFETVYSPLRTALVEAAEGAGLAVVDGLEMFARQAAAQSDAWTGVGGDVSRMRRVAGDWLGV